MTREEFAVCVLNWCDTFDASVTSWQRSTAHNTAVGGTTNSPHLLGRGADVIYDELPPLAARMEHARLLGLTVIPEHDHDHLQPAAWRGR